MVGVYLLALVVATNAVPRPETVTCRVLGMFAPDREADLRNYFADIPDVAVVAVNYAEAEITLRFVPQKLFPNQKRDRVLELLSNQLSDASRHTFKLKPRRTISRDKLTTVEIPATGLDCKACCLAAYEAIASLDGVYQATASFKDGKVTALIDAKAITQGALEDALRKRGVILGKR